MSLWSVGSAHGWFVLKRPATHGLHLPDRLTTVPKKLSTALLNHAAPSAKLGTSSLDILWLQVRWWFATRTSRTLPPNQILKNRGGKRNKQGCYNTGEPLRAVSFVSEEMGGIAVQ